MTQWYQGKGERSSEEGLDLPGSPMDRYTAPPGYLADPGLVSAVNVAIELGQPLLLTGEPGTGKTQLAYSVAWERHLEPVLKFETKSSSEARDLFYTYDALGRFNATQIEGADTEPIRFIDWNALGLAILRASEPADVKDLISAKQHSEKRRSVVLIDEVDKAPRDFPNDLLNEIEHMYFKIPELRGREVKADRKMRPILILTSNSEKNLPTAFLRRCVFYHIPFPRTATDPDDTGGGLDLRQIVERRLGESVAERPIVLEALDLFARLRHEANLLKPPSTSELLGFLHIVTSHGAASLREWPMIEQALSTMIKTTDDRKKARSTLEAWIQSQNNTTQ